MAPEIVDLTDDGPIQRPRKRARTAAAPMAAAPRQVQVIVVEDLCSVDSEVEIFEPKADELDTAVSSPPGADAADSDDEIMVTGEHETICRAAFDSCGRILVVPCC